MEEEALVRRPVSRSVVSVARQIAQADDVLAELTKQGWMAHDALEFSPAYRR